MRTTSYIYPCFESSSTQSYNECRQLFQLLCITPIPLVRNKCGKANNMTTACQSHPNQSWIDSRYLFSHQNG